MIMVRARLFMDHQDGNFALKRDAFCMAFMKNAFHE